MAQTFSKQGGGVQRWRRRVANASPKKKLPEGGQCAGSFVYKFTFTVLINSMMLISQERDNEKDDGIDNLQPT